MTYQVTVGVSAVFELLSSFTIFASRKWVNNLDVGYEWIKELQSLMNKEAAAMFAEATSVPFEDYDMLFALALAGKDNEEIEHYLSRLENSSQDELAHTVHSYMNSIHIDTIIRMKQHIIPLLRIWHNSYFKSRQQAYYTLLQEDAHEKQMLLEKMEPEGLVEYATGGLVLEPGLPLSEVMIVPSLHFRPINMYSFFDDLLLIQYPIDLPELDEEVPPIHLTRLTRALANPERLRLLKYIAYEPKSLSEIVQGLQESEELLKHHLLRLRVAGLLKVHLTDVDTEKYSIRPDGINELQLFLESYIGLA